MNIAKRSQMVGIIVAATFTLGACAEMGMMKDDEMMSEDMMEEASLYDRLGGQGAIEAVVGEFASRLAGDARINQRFAGTRRSVARPPGFRFSRRARYPRAAGRRRR